MAVFTVEGNPLTKIKVMPENEVEEVLQNINMILATVAGTCPLYRQFGIDNSFIDKPETVAQTMLIAEIYDKIEKYEPRAEVLSVEFKTGERPGKLQPVVEVMINAGN